MFNPAAFAAPAPYTYGTSGRDSLRLQPYWNFDTSLVRQFPIKEKARFEFRVDAFNLFNNVVYGFNALGASTPTAWMLSTCSTTWFMVSTPWELRLPPA